MKIKAGWYHGGCGFKYLVSEQGLVYVVAIPEIDDYGPPWRYQFINKQNMQRTLNDKYEYDEDGDSITVTSMEEEAIACSEYPIPERQVKGLPNFTHEINVSDQSYIYNI